MGQTHSPANETYKYLKLNDKWTVHPKMKSLSSSNQTHAAKFQSIPHTNLFMILEDPEYIGHKIY